MVVLTCGVVLCSLGGRIVTVLAKDLKHGQRFVWASTCLTATGTTDVRGDAITLTSELRVRFVPKHTAVELIGPPEATVDCIAVGAGGSRVVEPAIDPGPGWRLLEDDEIATHGTDDLLDYDNEWHGVAVMDGVSVGSIKRGGDYKAVRRRLAPAVKPSVGDELLARLDRAVEALGDPTSRVSNELRVIKERREAEPAIDPGPEHRLLEDGEIVRDGDEARSFATDWWEVSSPGRTLSQFIEFCPGVVAVRRRITPTYRPYTDAELVDQLGEKVRRKDGGGVLLVLAVSGPTIETADQVFAADLFLDEYEHLDGTPCGVKE